MVQLFSIFKIKLVLLGFLAGLIGSWFLTASRNFLLQQKSYMLLRGQFGEHVGHHEYETMLVDRLAKAMPVFAFIFTSAVHKEDRAVHIKNTWAKRFNKYIFFSDNEDSSLPSISLSTAKGWDHTRLAILYVHDNFRRNFSFFMKADDTNYVVVENLRAFLQQRSQDEPFLIGRQIMVPDSTTRYMSDESGYVMSRAALEKLSMGIKNNAEACKGGDASVDTILSKCATAVGVKLIHAMDQNKSDLFHPLPPAETLDRFLQKIKPSGNEFLPTQMAQALTSFSQGSVVFSNVKGAELYLLEYTTYHLYPYGIIRDPENYEKLKKLNNTVKH